MYNYYEEKILCGPIESPKFCLVVYTNLIWFSRFIKLQIILAPFKDFKAHPGHFELEVLDSTSIQGLKLLIQDHLGEAVDSVALFKEASCSKESYLVPSWCLEHCGMVGGSRMAPTSGCVYYDYMPAVNDCPILMDDSHIPTLTLVTSGHGQTRIGYKSKEKSHTQSLSSWYHTSTIIIIIYFCGFKI